MRKSTYKTLLAAGLVLWLSIPFVQAQEANDEQAIKAVINSLFQGMEKGDSAMVHNAFMKDITMATAYRDKDGNALLRRDLSLDGFLKAIATPHPTVWYEEIWDLEIQVDGDFAQAWCDYAFYTGNTFSHCGIDAFHLHKEKSGWRIFHLADTRKKSDCKIPKRVEAKHK